MKNYAKSVLYAYPLLKTVGKDYEEHIKNKALLSYDSNKTAEALAEYLAGEILQMRRLEWLKGRVESVLSKLSDVERAMVEIRYFKCGNRGKKFRCSGYENPLKPITFAKRTYFRRQSRLGEKLCSLLATSGITEEVFERDFADLELFREICRGVAAGLDKKIIANEARAVAACRR